MGELVRLGDMTLMQLTGTLLNCSTKYSFTCPVLFLFYVYPTPQNPWAAPIVNHISHVNRLMYFLVNKEYLTFHSYVG